MSNEKKSDAKDAGNRTELAKTSLIRRFLKPVIISMINGLLVASILIISAWYNLRDQLYVCRRQSDTRIKLRICGSEIRDYEKTINRLPESLDELKNLQERKWGLENFPNDEWGRPLQYTRKGNTFTLRSFGRDGLPGGVGLDADLYFDDHNHAETLATFSQFFGSNDPREVESQRFIWAAIVAGAFIAFTTMVNLFASRKQDLDNPWSYIAAIAITTLMAIFGGHFLMALHIPNGH